MPPVRVCLTENILETHPDHNDSLDLNVIAKTKGLTP
jgi:hypothetical protein